MDRLEAHRAFFAELITANARVPKSDGRLRAAFAAVPREQSVGPGLWRIFAGGEYIEAPSDDPALLYQHVVIALAPERKINNGQPVLHAFCLAALNLKGGEAVVHVLANRDYVIVLESFAEFGAGHGIEGALGPSGVLAERFGWSVRSYRASFVS